MSRISISTILALGCVAQAAPAPAELTADDFFPRMKNARVVQEMRSRATRPGTSAHTDADTTWVGYNPAYAGSNYWSIGVGHRRPRGASGPGKGDIPPVPDEDTGYWDWDHPVHGDSLQGWWPVRNRYRRFLITNQNDKLRPWHAIDIGNSISYVINQGPGHRRTYGVTSAWHADPGVNGKTPDPSPVKSDVNPKPPRWTPIVGGMSAWCGLRAHGDVTAVDPVTGNPYNSDALEYMQEGTPLVATAPGWTNYLFPGYASQWDQMLYRDVDISGAADAAPVSVGFKYRTRMSTGKGTNPTTRTGWFDKDPLTVSAGNFISSSDAGLGAPIDSFMVYVGAPVADTAGAPWTGSDGLTHQVFDPVRRWFGELIRANVAGGHYQLHTTYGDDPPIASPADSNAIRTVTAARNVTYGELRAAWGNRVRLVFRIKTNRGFSDDEGSFVGAYNSGYLGAAQVDDVSIDLGGGPVALGGFEDEGEIDNDPGVSALASWKTSSKPPAITFHVHGLADLIYEDLCGAPGSANRVCDLAGNVISMGDHDLGEAASGPVGTAEQDHYQAIFSPTINLAFDPGDPAAKNGMGLDADTAVPTSQFAIAYQMYTGFFDLFTTGQSWHLLFQSYPAVQADGTRGWGALRTFRFDFYNPEKECFDDLWFSEGDQVATSNPSGVPDSIRIGIRKFSECHRFGLTTGCGSTLGGYVDNMSLAIIDHPTPPISVFQWEFWNDTFPANETAGLPGTAAFDTTTALIKTGLNVAPSGFGSDFSIVPTDTTLVDAPGDSVAVQLVFRVLPGPGNYVVPGDRCSGLRRVPTDSTRISTGDGSFWTEYILNPGKDTDEMPATGDCKGGGTLRHDQRWSELVWCNARCDTAEQNVLPVQARGVGGPRPGTYASMYHEEDKHLAALGLPRLKCFVVDTLEDIRCGGDFFPCNVTCSSVPAWVTMGGPPYKTGYDGSPTTVEGTKILPDGLLTPGSHVQYFYVRKDLGTGAIALCPDSGVVYPQQAEGSLDAHRWQQLSVLPDAWKFSTYGGLGKACLLFVDWADGRGEERAWVSVADSIGATQEASRGAHNGWSAPGGADINDPAYFVNRNGQPGTTWDLYGVKGGTIGTGAAGSLGSRLAFRGPSLLTDKWAKNGPTLETMAAYYRIAMILTADISWSCCSSDSRKYDEQFLQQFLAGATAEDHRGLWCMGSNFVEDLQGTGSVLLDPLGVSLRDSWFIRFSGNGRSCIDLIPLSPITTNGDVYGIRNSCLNALDVLLPEGDAVAAAHYDPVGANPNLAPYVASVFADAETANDPARHFQTLVEGFTLEDVRSRGCDASAGRLAYVWRVFENVFGKICSIAGAPQSTLDVPGNSDGGAFVNLAGVGNNPLRAGHAVIHLSLAQADRVTVKIYDVSGRLVRTLADGQLFKAGRVDPALTWDGLDDGGRGVARGAYFVSVRYERSRYETAKKMIVLR